MPKIEKILLVTVVTLIVVLILMSACAPKIVTVTKEVPGDCPKNTSLMIGEYDQLGAGLIRVYDREKGNTCYFILGQGSPVCLKER